MCGILGLYSYNSAEVSPQIFDNFVDSLTHRGPDGRGVYCDKNNRIYLGHRRLLILDLSNRGLQPMSYRKKRYWITYNGEIYNFLELRAELEAKGHVFFSDSDTEVILASYCEWKEKCLLKFNGMWAFAIWDSENKELFISRDRFGIKPLYYYHDEKVFALSSEAKAFSFLPINMEFDAKEVSNAIYHPSLFEVSQKTLWKNVYKLPAGHFGVFHRNKGLKIHRYWDTKAHMQIVPDSFDEQIRQFKELLINACKIRMRSDVPLATALSGGLDSSSVLSIVSELYKSKISNERIPSTPITAFVARYPKTSQDEYTYAKTMIDYASVPHQVCNISPEDLIQCFDNVLYSLENIFDLPIGPWLLYKEYRKHNCWISIDGHGADELLGGYPHHIESLLLQQPFSRFSSQEFKETKKLLDQVYPQRSATIPMSSFQLALKKIKHKIKHSPSMYRSLKVIHSHLFKKQEIGNWLTVQPDKTPFFSPTDLKSLLFHDFHKTTLPVILRNFDKVSMAHGVEVRTPFLDWRLVTYCFSLQNHAFIKNGYTKYILREAMKGLMPEEIRVRKSKVGFASPMMQWYANGLRSFVLDTVNSSSFLTSEIWDGHKIRSHLERCYKSNDWTGAKKSWEFLQAHRLMQLFSLRKKECSS